MGILRSTTPPLYARSHNTLPISHTSSHICFMTVFHISATVTLLSPAATHTSRSLHLLKVLQMSDTALKTRSEKLTLTFMCFMLGSWRRRSLCCGVKSSLASAWMPYLSNVQWVFSNHVFFFSHHKAWSDQSFFTSMKGQRRGERITFSINTKDAKKPD